MEVEILLDVAEERDPAKLAEIEKRFQDWYAEGSEARYGKPRFEYLEVLDKPFRYLVNFGQADATRALQQLHSKLNRHGVKVFVHFMH